MIKLPTHSVTVIAALALTALPGCGSSGPSAKQQALTVMRQQTLPIGPGGSNVGPTQVSCDSAGAKCKATYPDGQVQDCTLSISGSSSNVSCTSAPRAKAKKS